MASKKIKKQILREMKSAGIKNRFKHFFNFDKETVDVSCMKADIYETRFCGFKISTLYIGTREEVAVIDEVTGKELLGEQAEAVQRIAELL